MIKEEKDKLIGDHHLPLKVTMKKVFHYIKPEWKRFLFAGILIILNVILDVILPLITGQITNNLKKETIDIQVIILFVCTYFGISIINNIFLYFESMFLQKAGETIVCNLRIEVFTHIESMSINQFNEMSVGSLVTRVCNYTQSMSDLFTNVLVNVIKNLLTIFAVYGVMLSISYKLSLALLPIVIIVFILSYFFSKEGKKIFKRERAYISEMNTFLNENLSGMKLIQIFNKENDKHEEFKEKNTRLWKNKYRLSLLFGLFRPSINLIYYCTIALTFYLGLKFTLNPGELVSFYLLLSKFFNPVQNLADQINNLQKAFTSSERLFNLLDVKPDVLDSKDSKDIESFKGKIEFRNVWFAYNDDNWILKDVSFIINPKESCAFVGATGAGKTTILQLIVRNYEPQKGDIFIDDINIKNITISSLRRAIGQMLQDVFLFSGSIKNNITLNNDKYTDEEIIETCKYVNASNFIEKLPNKYNEEVMESGSNLSSGERQLLSFARVVISSPQILILDEATSNIDTETESLIQDSLKKISTLGTMLVVAHRLSTIQHCTQIIVLQNGKIIEKGNHQELLKQKGFYYKLYELQFKK